MRRATHIVRPQTFVIAARRRDELRLACAMAGLAAAFAALMLAACEDSRAVEDSLSGDVHREPSASPELEPSTGPAPADEEAPGAEVEPEGTWTLDLETPLSRAAPPFSAVNHPLAPTSLWGETRAPLPTNRFWMSLVLGDGTERINLHPYQVRGRPQDLAISVPEKVVAPLSVTTPADVHLTLGAAETFRSRAVVAHDAAGVTLRFDAPAGTMTTPLVSGMAYVTARYANLAPRIGTGGAAVTAVEASSAGTRFDVSTNDGRRWLVYTSAPIDFAWDSAGLTARGPFTGDVRIASLFSPSLEPILDAHAGAIPLGARVGAAITGDSATLNLSWVREGSGPLLTFALPHHRERLREASVLVMGAPSLFGELAAVEGDRWSLEYPLPAMTWDAPRPVEPARLAAVEAALVEDSTFVPDPEVVGSDPYFGGKQLAKLARLIVIARALGRTDLAAVMTDRLVPLVEAWLDGSNANPLVYDRTWGGLVTTRGLADRYADFGQGYYNDHHFHYGYLIYAAAVIARERPEWAAAREEHVLALVRDIMNPSTTDPYFSAFRPFDFFFGHSWAGGLFVFADGRNQESTSEAVHAWYATQLFGLAAGRADVANTARLLLAMEIVSSQKYWQVREDVPIYPAPFRDFGVVGILWETKVDATTWFGGNPEYVFGIQMLPYTPVSEALLDARWVRGVWPKLEPLAAGAMPSWRSTLLMSQAIIDPDAAWQVLERETGLDDGNSRANALYWAATRR